jgi:hypothetical protein
MEKLHLKVSGLTPMLMHNPAGSMIAGGGRKVSRKTIPSPEEEAKASRYLLPDGNFFVPAIAVRNSILGGAKGYRIGRTAAISIISGALDIIDEVFPLLRDGQPIDGDDYSIDTRRAVVQGQGIMRSRARIEPPWEVVAIFGYNPDLVNLDQIKDIANNAGHVVGLLDYRPEKKVGLPGWFGKFEVVDIWSE